MHLIAFVHKYKTQDAYYASLVVGKSGLIYITSLLSKIKLSFTDLSQSRTWHWAIKRIHLYIWTPIIWKKTSTWMWWCFATDIAFKTTRARNYTSDEEFTFTSMNESGSKSWIPAKYIYMLYYNTKINPKIKLSIISQWEWISCSKENMTYINYSIQDEEIADMLWPQENRKFGNKWDLKIRMFYAGTMKYHKQLT